MAPKIKLAVFDFDNVLSKDTQIIELAKRKGVLSEVLDLINAWKFHGRNFAECHIAAIKLLEGLEEKEIKNTGENLRITDGAQQCVQRLIKKDISVIIISNGYVQTCNMIAKKTGVSKVFANHLLIRNGKLSGGLIPIVIDDVAKKRVLRKVLLTLGIKKNECATIGDDINDIPMMSESGLSIAFNPEDPKIRETANIIIENEQFERIADYIL